MLFGKKPYPILPTSESDTLTFLQKLDLLEYKVAEMTNKVYEIETTLATKSSVSATASGGVIQTITVDGTSYNVPQGTEVSATDDDGVLQTLTIGDDTYTVPQGTEVSATDDDGVLQTLTIGDDTYTVPQGGEAGDSGNATVGGNSIAQWRLIDDMFFLELVVTAGTDAFSNKSIGIRLKKGTDYYNGLDGKTLKTVISWKHSTTWYTAVLQINIILEGLGNLTIVDPSTAPTDAEILTDLKGLPFTFMNVSTL